MPVLSRLLLVVKKERACVCFGQRGLRLDVPVCFNVSQRTLMECNVSAVAAFFVRATRGGFDALSDVVDRFGTSERTCLCGPGRLRRAIRVIRSYRNWSRTV